MQALGLVVATGSRPRASREKEGGKTLSGKERDEVLQHLQGWMDELIYAQKGNEERIKKEGRKTTDAKRKRRGREVHLLSLSESDRWCRDIQQ